MLLIYRMPLWNEVLFADFDGLRTLLKWPNATVERNAVWKRIMSRNDCRLPDC